MAKKDKETYSTKENNIPESDSQRQDMIAKFIKENKNNDELYQVFEAVPYETDNMVRSTTGKKRKA
jgi:hypothetical protein